MPPQVVEHRLSPRAVMLPGFLDSSMQVASLERREAAIIGLRVSGKPLCRVPAVEFRDTHLEPAAVARMGGHTMATKAAAREGRLFLGLLIGLLGAAWLVAGCAQRANGGTAGGSRDDSPAPAVAQEPDADADSLRRVASVYDPRVPQAQSPLGRPLLALPSGPDTAEAEAQLQEALEAWRAAPEDVERIIWLGRRLGYLWRMRAAIEVYTYGIELHPNEPALYRHRGHRYISLRQFDKALADLRHAAVLIDGRRDVAEPDGQPGPRGTPLTTLAYNVHYHLGVAHYALGDFDSAIESFGKTVGLAGRYEDNLVAALDWLYMSTCRAGREDAARRLLDAVRVDADVQENFAYHRRLMLYKELLTPEELLDMAGASDIDRATLAYGLGNWHLCHGRTEEALAIFEQIVAGDTWPAFGFIAAEAELARRAKD